MHLDGMKRTGGCTSLQNTDKAVDGIFSEPLRRDKRFFLGTFRCGFGRFFAGPGI